MHCNAKIDDCQLRWLRNEPRVVVFKLANFVQHKAARSTFDTAPHAGFTSPLLRSFRDGQLPYQNLQFAA
jgi:hypothetical protein